MTPDQQARVTAHFTAQSLPRHAGLYVNTCLVQRMGCGQTDTLNAAWYESLTSLTRRDQVMLPWLLASHACPHRVLGAKIRSWVDWPIFSPKARARFRRKQIAA
jgi:hypothetical protein